MKNYIIAFILCCLLHHSVFADQSAVNQFKKIGYALANYEMCELVATQSNDPVMAYYYAEMLLDGEVSSKAYILHQQQTIKQERAKAVQVLNKMSRASMNQLCASRFDAVSRQFYQKKQQENNNRIPLLKMN